MVRGAVKTFSETGVRLSSRYDPFLLTWVAFLRRPTVFDIDGLRVSVASRLPLSKVCRPLYFLCGFF